MTRTLPTLITLGFILILATATSWPAPSITACGNSPVTITTKW